MVNIIVNKKNDPSLIYNVSSDIVDYPSNPAANFPNAIENMAHQAGLVDLAQNMNNEAREYDQQLRENGEEEDFFQDLNESVDQPQVDNYENQQNYAPDPEQEIEKRKRKIAKKKAKTQERFEDITVKYSMAIQEKDAYKYKLEEALHQLEQQKVKDTSQQHALLATQKDLYDRELETASEVMFEARESGDRELEKKAAKIMHQLQYEQMATEQQIESIKYHQAESQNARTDPRESILRETYDKKELEGEGLESWLKENPECNPYSSEFNEDYFHEVTTIKRNLNKWLVGQRKKSLIGSDEYYEILDQSLSQHFGREPMNKSEYPEQYANHDPQSRARNYYTDIAQRPSSGHIPQSNNNDSFVEVPQYYPEYQQQGYNPNSQTARTHTVHIPFGQGGSVQGNPYPQQRYAPPPPPPYQPQYQQPQQRNAPYSPVSRVSREGYSNPQYGNGAPPALDAQQQHIALSIMPRVDPTTGQQLSDFQRIQNYQRNMLPGGRR